MGGKGCTFRKETFGFSTGALYQSVRGRFHDLHCRLKIVWPTCVHQSVNVVCLFEVLVAYLHFGQSGFMEVKIGTETSSIV